MCESRSVEGVVSLQAMKQVYCNAAATTSAGFCRSQILRLFPVRPLATVSRPARHARQIAITCLACGAYVK